MFSQDLTLSGQHETEAAKQLCRSPAMHRSVVPAQIKLTAAERSFFGLPMAENLLNRSFQVAVERREASPKQHGEIDALRIVVQFALVDGEPWRLGERFRN